MSYFSEDCGITGFTCLKCGRHLDFLIKEKTWPECCSQAMDEHFELCEELDSTGTYRCNKTKGKHEDHEFSFKWSTKQTEEEEFCASLYSAAGPRCIVFNGHKELHPEIPHMDGNGKKWFDSTTGAQSVLRKDPR